MNNDINHFDNLNNNNDYIIIDIKPTSEIIII